MIVTAGVVAACSGGGGGQPGLGPDAATGDGGQEIDAIDEGPQRDFPINIGMTEPPGDFANFRAFRLASNTPSHVPRLCHIYTYFDIAEHDPPGGSGTHSRAGLISWFASAGPECDEVLVTFQGPQHTAMLPPSASSFEHAFLAFQAMSSAGQPLSAWATKLTYTAWNEPNNALVNGNGLLNRLSPELAAEYYLALRRHCSPSDGCKVAAGDFATNGNFNLDLMRNCADDNDPANTPTRCAHTSVMNPTNAPPSYLDRYKNYISVHAPNYGLPNNFRPEYFAYHPWQDVNEYIRSNAKCSDYNTCGTRRLIESLGGSWGHTEIWDDEIGIGLQFSAPIDTTTTHPCGAAFLMQLTKLDPRITRVYYMHFSSGNGRLYDGTTLRPAGGVLAARATTYAGATCPPTGMTP
jgi:hypothetical protein